MSDDRAGREIPRAKFEEFTPAGLAAYTMPEGERVRVSAPDRYMDWPELWPNPAIDYPWRARWGERNRLGVRPNVHVEYVIILSTLHKMGGSLTNSPANNAGGALETACEPPLNTEGLEDTHVMSSRLTELDKLGYIRSVKASPKAKRRREIHLTDKAKALLNSGTIPLAYEVYALRKDLAETAEEQDEAETETETEAEASTTGGVVVDEPGETEAVASPAPPTVPPALPSDDLDLQQIAIHFFNYAIEQIVSGGEEATAYLKAQLGEAQRQVGILRDQVRKASEAADTYKKQRDVARAAALNAENARKDTERNLEAVVNSARNGQVSPRAREIMNDFTAKMMAEKPKSR